MAGLDISSDDDRLPDLSGLGAIVAAFAVFAGGAGVVIAIRALPGVFRALDDAIPIKADYYRKYTAKPESTGSRFNPGDSGHGATT